MGGTDILVGAETDKHVCSTPHLPYDKALAMQSRRMSVRGVCSMDDGLDSDDFDEVGPRPDKSFSDEQLWLEVDSYVQRFEEAWQKGGRPNVDDFLPSGDRRLLPRRLDRAR